MKNETPAEVRTRFAPSPTGYLHVGGARTALFNYLYARACNGKMILRIEDTDQERSTPDSERMILESLTWLGIHSDEGPLEGGSCGPYRQSERLETYRKYTDRLVEEGKAYPCFCSDDELEVKQQQSRKLGVPHVYDGKCRNLSAEERQKRIESGEKYAIRFRTTAGEILVDDMVQGRVKFDARLIGDFIIVKSDGFPSYNYAVVIDDYEMKISHVIRGVGHLSNTPRQIMIHDALNLPLPSYAHISEIVGTDKKKLSKRKGATSILFFKELGYLSPAFVNYMALLGWYPEDGVEFMPDGKLEKKFDVARCSKSPAMFDFFLSDRAGSEGEDFNPALLKPEEIKPYINGKTKLNWLNNKYIRYVDLEELWPQVLPFLESDEKLSALLKEDSDRVKLTFDTVRVYLNTLDDATAYMLEIFRDSVTPVDEETATWTATEEAKSLLKYFVEVLSESDPKEPEDYSGAMKEAGKRAGAKGKQLFMTIRVASTGQMHGLELPTLFSLLGKEVLIERIQKSIS